jgi:hypothetical protein
VRSLNQDRQAWQDDDRAVAADPGGGFDGEPAVESAIDVIDAAALRCRHGGFVADEQRGGDEPSN